MMRWAVWLGALMLVASVALQIVFPRAMGPLPSGLRTPVLALEIARSPAEIESMFGAAGSDERAHWAARVDRGDAIDFAFIAIYGSFLIACMHAFPGSRPAHARVGTALALLACAADVIENLSLFGITARLGGDYTGALSVLIAATWTKWVSIAACLAVLSPGLRRQGRWGSATGWLAAAALPVSLGAALLRGVVAEIMLLVITLSFVAIWIEALLSRRKASEQAR